MDFSLEDLKALIERRKAEEAPPAPPEPKLDLSAVIHQLELMNLKLGSMVKSPRPSVSA